MRPLVVLLLVLVAAVALILALQNFGPSTPTVPLSEVGGPAAVPPPTKAPTPETVQTPKETVRTAEEAVQAGEGVNADAAVERPGRNTLYGLVMNQDKQPLRGAKVQLSRDAMMGQEVAMSWITGVTSGTKPIVTTSDEKGAYRFQNVIPRRDYFLIASHPNYSPVQEQLVAVGDDGEFQGPNIILKTGSIVQGTVTDTSNNVVPNAELWLDSAFYSGQGESPDRLIVKSDLLGHFEFANVYPVAKQLTCSAEGYGTQTRSQVNIQGTPGERVIVDIQLSVGQPIGGKVIGSDGAGIKDAVIVAYNTGNNVSYRGETKSLEDGTFALMNLHPGSYILQCEAKGYRQQKNTRVAVGEMNVIIDMLAQACVNGRVVDNAGNAVTAFTVSVRRLAPNQVPGIGVASEETGLKESFSAATDGNFQICGLDPSTYCLVASSNTSAPTFSEAFAITADRPSINVVVRLSRGGSIKGRIVGPNGAPIGGAVVTSHDDTFDDDPNDPMFGMMIPTNTTSRRVVTTSEGMFELRFLTPEKYQLRVNHPSFAQGKQREIMVADGQPTDVGQVTLQVGGTVKGTVVGPGGTPLRGGFVHMESDTSDIVLDTRSDAEGRFSFSHVRPGNYTLSATVQGVGSDDAFGQIDHMVRSQKLITVSEGSDQTYELSLTGG